MTDKIAAVINSLLRWLRLAPRTSTLKELDEWAKKHPL
jgi:hypothetical protein